MKKISLLRWLFWLAVSVGACAYAQAAAPGGAVGVLSIQCSFACRIVIPGIQPTDTGPQDHLQKGDIPVGTYTATFTGFNKQLTHTFEITEGATTHFVVNIASGKVTDGTESASAPSAPPPARAPAAPPPAKTAPKAAPAPAGAAAKAKALEMFSGPRFVVPGAGITMLAVEPGTFTMGSLTGSQNEKPLTHVTLSHRFWLARTEVTQAQWQTLMDYNNSPVRAPDEPITNVSWENVMDFCLKLTERERNAGRLPEGCVYVLPTEAMWEYACRAGSPNDGDLMESAWFDLTSGGQPHPVGQKQPNAWGFFDMHGNVEEWCFDWFDTYPGGTENIPDFAGPSQGSRHAIRGGAFAFKGTGCRSSSRSSEIPGNSHPNVGFRLALVKVR
ncbi:MAG TPA: formylglycine-generating enzyme family protein [Opitutaceae bacterium]|nr:formylglycine-generating enzyme family protein [Opitutaceae bacterium]